MLGGTFGILVMVGFSIMLFGVLMTVGAMVPIVRSRDELEKSRLYGAVSKRWRQAGMIALPVTIAPYVWLDYTLDRGVLADPRNAQHWELYGSAAAFVCVIFLIAISGEVYFEGKIKELEKKP
jgi:hypothetical protein